MKVKWVVLVASILPVGLLAQERDKSDLVSFIPPSGWKKEVTESAVAFSTINQAAGTWCQLGIYKSIKSSGVAQTDFDAEWKNIVVKTYSPTTQPKCELESAEGWTVAYGLSTFQWQGKESYVLLYTITGHGRLSSVTITMNSQDYMKDIEKFVGSMEFIPPDPVEEVAKPTPTTSSLIVTDAPANPGFTIVTTNFDDGWVAQPFADYVHISKGNLRVLLHYPIKIDDELRNSNDVQGTLFDRLILPRYQLSSVSKYDNGGPCYFCIYFFEADAVEKSTGKQVHLGFRVITESGISRCIEIVSPSASEFRTAFPDQEKVAGMLAYNKFAVTAKDLTGTWEESTGSGIDMYNTVTGSYAGMNTTSAYSSFVFNADGSYSSNHKGAMGMVGNMKFYDQKYKGKITVTNWEVTLTNRFEGKTDIFWASFEAVRGGSVLHLVDSTAPGNRYNLVKAK